MNIILYSIFNLKSFNKLYINNSPRAIALVCLKEYVDLYNDFMAGFIEPELYYETKDRLLFIFNRYKQTLK